MSNSEQYHFAIYFAYHFEGKLLQGCSQHRYLFLFKGKEEKHKEQHSEEEKRNMLASSLTSW